ncbi:MAG: metal-dependent transcriptional regulator [Gemmatimonadetes bacterium]|nr:metal-dependent transcriptional regulator [Gemmatimonadota bacterium]
MVSEIERPAPEQSHTRAVEDYLKAICVLQRETGSVQTSALAQRLSRTPASVTNMVKSLAEQGLVEHVPYYGVRLTLAGERAALRVIRRHRLIELYLIRHLGYSWDRVHAEAERLEHAASDELVERISAVLGHPEIDPHGSPIPGPEGEWQERTYPALSELMPGQTGVVREVSDADPERLRYLADLGLYPSTPVTVLGRAPFEGPLRVLVRGEEKLVGSALAAMVRVELTHEQAR